MIPISSYGNRFSSDKKANLIILSHINWGICDMLKEEFEEYLDKDCYLMKDKLDNIAMRKLANLLPNSIPEKHLVDIYNQTWLKLTSPVEANMNYLNNYLIYSIIDNVLQEFAYDETSIEYEIEKNDRKYVIEKLELEGKVSSFNAIIIDENDDEHEEVIYDIDAEKVENYISYCLPSDYIHNDLASLNKILITDTI